VRVLPFRRVWADFTVLKRAFRGRLRFQPISRLVLLAVCTVVVSWVESAVAQPKPLDRGLPYLRSTQASDGSWGGVPASLATPLQSTATAARTLQMLGLNDATLASALSFLVAQSLTTVEELALQTEVLAAAGLDVSALVARLKSARRRDGGWGLDLDRVFGSQATDTIASLRALHTARALDSQTAATGLSYLLAQQNADGGWGGAGGQPSDIFYTALALLLLKDFQTTFDLAQAVARASAFLVGRQNSDGSFGGGSPFETALVVQALFRFVVDASVLSRSVNHLVSTQVTNGSWGDDAYSTALALRALRDAEAADQDLDNDGDGVTERQGDCNDANPGVHPGAVDPTVNGVDEDCNGIDGPAPGATDGDGDGFPPVQGDCNDADPSIHPGAVDPTVNGIDEDCNGIDGPPAGEADADGDGFTAAQGDCSDADPNVHPGAPDLTVNGIDENCDGVDGPVTGAEDTDGDGFTIAQGDCDDTNASIRPGASDIPENGIDEDCNGQDAVFTVRILALNLFKVIGTQRTSATTFGAFETMGVEVVVNDPAAQLVVFVPNSAGLPQTLPFTDGEFRFQTLNRAPGSYEVTARALDAGSGVLLDQHTQAFTIAPTVAVSDVALNSTPPFTNAGVTETVALNLSVTNRSNVDANFAIEFIIKLPSGGVLRSGEASFGLPSGAIGSRFELTTFSHTFTESGEYPVQARLLSGATVLAAPTALISVAPAVRIDATQTLTPQTVAPDADRRLRVNIRLSASAHGEATVADSEADFSGVQGQAGWFYGYVAPASGPDLILMTQFESSGHPLGAVWWAANGTYWTSLWGLGGHPNGLVTSGGRVSVEHWAVRRWISRVEGGIRIVGRLAKENIGSVTGDGVVGRVIVDGVEVWSQHVAGTDVVGTSFDVRATVARGSTVDFRIEPFGTDISDSTRFTAKIVAAPPSVGSAAADGKTVNRLTPASTGGGLILRGGR
jgi:hypothetical protein